MASINSGTSGRPTGLVYVDTLVWGGSWTPSLGQGVTLNVSVRNAGAQFPTQTWSSDETASLMAALQTWANVANIKFTTDASKSADIEYFKVSDDTMSQITQTTGVLGYHETPDGTTSRPLEGVFNAGAFSAANLTPGADGFLTLVHEIGHGLGLAHPHDGGGSGEVFPGVTPNDYADLGDHGLNQQVYTVMSYNIGWDVEPAGTYLWGEPLGPMALDIAAIQTIYGANNSYNTGDNSYLLPQANAAGTGWSCIWDAGGSDTLSNAGSSSACTIDLREATLSGANAGGYISWIQGIAGGFTIAHGALVENATGGAADDSLIGNAAANVLDGGSGADTMSGGDGDDTYVVDNTGDLIAETNATATGGVDLVRSSITYTLGANLEHLTLTGVYAIDGAGNELDNLLTGNSAINVLSGGGGRDTLNGGGGADTLAGGGDDDTYLIDDAAASIVENFGEGEDRVLASVSYSLGAYVESLTLTGTAAIDGTGNDQDNTLTGNAAANRLDGGGGSDTLIGGDGDDIYVVDSAGDSVVELAEGGSDLVRAAISYALGDYLENLTLTGSADLSATGNALNNTISGNLGANLLDGGEGMDVLKGDSGDDTYYVDVTATRLAVAMQDAVVEEVNAGTDTIVLRTAAPISLGSPTTFTVGDNIENFDISGLGATRLNLTGNALANTLTGNAAGNVLDGGLGADLLIGGDGDDIYIIDDPGDLVSETKGNEIGGYDWIKSAVSYALGDHLEKLSLTGGANVNGTGNGLDNLLVGNGGNNILDGGTGIDSLAGGAGDDTYHVDLILDQGVLRIEDQVSEAKNAGTDRLVFRSAAPLIFETAVTLATAANIEGFDISATGTALINLTGNTQNNILIGNAAANVIDGGSGADDLQGGDGDDTYTVDDAGDTVTESNAAAEGGVDRVLSAVSFTLGANVENLTLTGKGNVNATGNGLANVLVGNGAVNVLSGGAGDDTLDGGAKADTLVGGKGNDSYYVDAKGELVVEEANEGIDQVTSMVSYALAAHVENLSLGGNAAINGSGNELANIIIGNGASNVLDGGGGADLLIGGEGHDTYIVDSLADSVVESQSGNVGGIDTVKSGVTYTLGQNLERLTLTGIDDINGTGNELENTLLGNSGANVLDGRQGADTLSGGAGNDTYIVDLIVAGNRVDFEDKVTEFFASGTDTVFFRTTTPLTLETMATLTVAANLENYDLSATGTALLSLNGNALRNVLTGNAADNLLDGLAGADTLIGGDGSDTYVVDNLADVVIETNAAAAGGIDLIRSSVNFVLGANQENLTLTGGRVINGHGNALDNLIIGNSLANLIGGGDGDDILSGAGGNDTLTGGNGRDIFLFDSTPKSRGNTDTLTDFDEVSDGIRFDVSVFTAFKGMVNLSAENLVVGTKAADANDFLIYNAGTLYYDSDGSGNASAAPIATLTGVPALNYTHFSLTD